MVGLLIPVITAFVLFAGPRPAWACSGSCTSPSLVAFEGTVEDESGVTAVVGRDYQFDVETVVAGDVKSAETVRVFTWDSSGTCGAFPRLLVGRRYRVSAYISSLEDEERRLFVTSLCDTKAELIPAAVSEGDDGLEDRGGGSRTLILAVLASVGAGAAFVGTRALRRWRESP